MENKGVTKLPPGFRFHPTDQELVLQYLRRKAFNYPLPADVILDIDLLKFNPWDLPGGLGEEKYFFNQNEAKYMSGSRSNRATSHGYWKATGKEKQIYAMNSRGHQVVVGLKKVLVFYQGRPPRGSRTDWVMHEYRLASSPINSVVSTNGWVLCRIFKKKRATKTDESETEPEVELKTNTRTRNRNFIDFFGQRENININNNLRTSPSHSSDSCVTEVPEEETTSAGLSLCTKNDQEMP